MNPLAKIIAADIETNGPMPLDRYMTLCLAHPQHGYYMTRDPFGASGDFTTAPEISQIFGELIGIWVVQAWQALGEPRHFALAELGPGRGTLMTDMLRVLSKSPKCQKAAEVHFVEMSPVLREAQRERVPDATWHGSVASLPPLPSIVIANEFFDALPIRQFERHDGKISELCIGLENGMLKRGRVPAFANLSHHDGIYEDATIRSGVATALAHHLTTSNGLGLIIDYGHFRSAPGDTLQAMKNHSHVDICESPGECDLTSHVDFQSLGEAFTQGGMTIAGTVTQGRFLNAMGLEPRTEKLSQSLFGTAKNNLISASERLAHPTEMGDLFKVMAVTSAGLSPPYPFGAQ